MESEKLKEELLLCKNLAPKKNVEEEENDDEYDEFDLFKDPALIFKEEKDEEEVCSKIVFSQKVSAYTKDTATPGDADNADLYDLNQEEDDANRKSDGSKDSKSDEKSMKFNFYFKEDNGTEESNGSEGAEGAEGNQEDPNFNLIKFAQDLEAKQRKEFFTKPENISLLNSLPTSGEDQITSRAIQSLFVNETKFAKEFFYPKIKEYLLELSMNQFGNYLIQSILQSLTEKEQMEFILILKPNFYTICKSFHGTRVMQKLIEYITDKEVLKLLLENISLYFPDIINDLNGAHIIFKLFGLKDKDLNIQLFSLIEKNLMDIAKHKHGCCSIQKAMECDTEHSQSLAKLILKNANALLREQFGNFLIHFLITYDKKKYLADLITEIKPYFVDLCRQKYSSSALEKFFEFCDENEKKPFYLLLSNVEIFQILLLNKFGNYVIQKMISKAQNFQIKIFFLSQVASLSNILMKESFGKQILGKFYKMYPEFREIVKNKKVTKPGK